MRFKMGAGFVSGPEPIARIVITDVTGAEHEVPVVDGWVTFPGTVINHADSRNAPGELHLTVTQLTEPSLPGTTRTTELGTAGDART